MLVGEGVVTGGNPRQAVADLVTAGGLTYLFPGVLIAAGVIGLAASRAGTRNRRSRHTTDLPAQGENTEEIR